MVAAVGGHEAARAACDGGVISSVCCGVCRA